MAENLELILTRGFGHSAPKWVLHIANRPPLDAFLQDEFRTLATGEAADIIRQTSNHWRKVFSIMAKISFALFDTNCDTWQQYRDTKLLTSQGFEAINYHVYVPQELETYTSLVAGFQYASEQLDLDSLVAHHRCNKLLRIENRRCFVTPYFDWRQLNNDILDILISAMETASHSN